MPTVEQSIQQQSSGATGQMNNSYSSRGGRVGPGPEGGAINLQHDELQVEKGLTRLDLQRWDLRLVSTASPADTQSFCTPTEKLPFGASALDSE